MDKDASHATSYNACLVEKAVSHTGFLFKKV